MNIQIKNLWKKNASEIIDILSKREVSALEVLDSSLSRIEEINPRINAIVTLIKDEAKKI